MRMVITGTTGYLGGRLTAYFGARAEVFAPTRAEMDICDEGMTRGYIARVRPQVVIHCAAVSQVARCEEAPELTRVINVQGSLNVARAAGEAGAKCILCSSDQVYFGSRVTEAHRETEALQPANAYGRQKLEMETLCLRADPDAVALRLTWMYDVRTLQPGEHGDFIKTFRGQLAEGGEMRYPVFDRRGITDVNEVAANMEKALSLPGGVYNFGAENDLSTYETVQKVLKALGRTGARENRDSFADDPRNISMDTAKAQAHGIAFSDTATGILRAMREE